MNRVYKEYLIPLELYSRLKQSLKYNFNEDNNELVTFVDELPYKLKVEISLFIYEKTYEKISFLHAKSSTYIAWICPLLKPYYNPEKTYIYFEGDAVNCIYFLKDGECGYVLPKHQNLKYIDIPEGDYLGISDIVGSAL